MLNSEHSMVKPGRVYMGNSCPRLILLTGHLSSRKFGFLDQFLAYQCQANRFVALIDKVSSTLDREDASASYHYMISDINQAYLRCSLTGSLRRAVEDILKTYQPDFIILEESKSCEMTGLMKRVFDLNDLIRFDNLTVVIDSFSAERSLEISQEMIRQVEMADILLLEKKELLDEIRLQHLIRSLREINAIAPIVSVNSRSFDPLLVYGINLLNFETVHPAEEGELPPECDNGVCDHLFALRCELGYSFDRDQFLRRLEGLAEKFYRFEGVLSFRGERFPVHVQYINGRVDIRQYPNPMCKERFIVVVGRNPETTPMSFQW